MKKIMTTLLFILIAVTIYPQENNYIRISGDMGFVANTGRDKKFGLGGTISWVTVDHLISKSDNNFFAFHLKGFNNPYMEGKIISSILNKKNDAFNYILPLVGYRITRSGMANGLFIEPRAGVAIGAGKYTAFTLSPLIGYTSRNFEYSLFCDMGFGGKNSAMLKKYFFTPGISVAYNIAIY